MGWIKTRIEAEKRKHGSMSEGLEKYNLDWARLAESKIVQELRNRGMISVNSYNRYTEQYADHKTKDDNNVEEVKDGS